MGDPPSPPNTWPLAPNQPFYIQTMTGPAIYNPYTGLFYPVFATNSAPSSQFPAPPQPIAGTPAANASAAVASPSSPPPAPFTSAVSQSTYSPFDNMVEALEALSAKRGEWGPVFGHNRFVYVALYTKIKRVMVECRSNRRGEVSHYAIIVLIWRGHWHHHCFSARYSIQTKMVMFAVKDDIHTASMDVNDPRCLEANRYQDLQQH